MNGTGRGYKLKPGILFKHIWDNFVNSNHNTNDVDVKNLPYKLKNTWYQETMDFNFFSIDLIVYLRHNNLKELNLQIYFDLLKEP